MFKYSRFRWQLYLDVATNYKSCRKVCGLWVRDLGFGDKQPQLRGAAVRVHI